MSVDHAAQFLVTTYERAKEHYDQWVYEGQGDVQIEEIKE